MEKQSNTNATTSKVCPQLPGTVLRVFIPAGAVINLLNLLEITSPSGICIIVRLPILGAGGLNISSIVNTIQQAGGTIEFMSE
ncbi:hypothetical protein Amet_0105 [Alkaliphilus metalliredigens QYMF]|uniref:Uncharacterized protein n=1 Tax=Alkaliphilus metalliredigens (strain QYMF) TaxID=293826 RepID=A6TJI0_ALKMQ|nr:hypothetical protein [Alkaliphilus metalliredigens]ABR46348.1 hypothetical protein Amet_0105 [Alkaliphilus metalliredigens QYMF]